MTNYGISDIVDFEIMLQCRVTSLCNQLLPEFSSNQFETSQRCYKHVEDVYLTFKEEIISTKLQHFTSIVASLHRFILIALKLCR